MLIITLLILEPTKLPSLLQSILLLLFVSEVRLEVLELEVLELEVLELEVLEFLERVIFICMKSVLQLR